MTEGKNLGFDWNSDIIQVADSLYNQQIPKLWCILSGSRVHFPFYPLASFFSDLTVRAQHIERCLTLVYIDIDINRCQSLIIYLNSFFKRVVRKYQRLI